MPWFDSAPGQQDSINHLRVVFSLWGSQHQRYSTLPVAVYVLLGRHIGYASIGCAKTQNQYYYLKLVTSKTTSI